MYNFTSLHRYFGSYRYMSLIFLLFCKQWVKCAFRILIKHYRKQQEYPSDHFERPPTESGRASRHDILHSIRLWKSFATDVRRLLIKKQNRIRDSEANYFDVIRRLVMSTTWLEPGERRSKRPKTQTRAVKVMARICWDAQGPERLITGDRVRNWEPRRQLL